MAEEVEAMVKERGHLKNRRYLVIGFVVCAVSGCLLASMLMSTTRAPQGALRTGKTHSVLEILKYQETRYYLLHSRFTNDENALKEVFVGGDWGIPVRDGWENKIGIQASAHDVSFRSPGPDGLVGNSDDIIDSIAAADIKDAAPASVAHVAP